MKNSGFRFSVNVEILKYYYVKITANYSSVLGIIILLY